MTNKIYFETDEAEDVAGSIRHALRCADLVQEDCQAWKWGMLALHSALQGACVCHLTTNDSPFGAFTKKSAINWVTYHDESRINQDLNHPETMLLNFPDLLKAVRKSGSSGGAAKNTPIEITDAELDWLTRIHSQVRNQFVHFEPSAWSIEVSGIPHIGRIIARIIKDIHDCGWAFRHMNSTRRNAMVLDLEHLKEATWKS